MKPTPSGIAAVSTVDADFAPSKNTNSPSRVRQKTTAVQVELLGAVIMAAQFLPKLMFWKCASFFGVVGRYKN
jgi:hypothetical protein